MVEPISSNFRVITTNILGVPIFRKFTVIGIDNWDWETVTISSRGQRQIKVAVCWSDFYRQSYPTLPTTDAGCCRTLVSLKMRSI